MSDNEVLPDPDQEPQPEEKETLQPEHDESLNLGVVPDDLRTEDDGS